MPDHFIDTVKGQEATSTFSSLSHQDVAVGVPERGINTLQPIAVSQVPCPDKTIENLVQGELLPGFDHAWALLIHGVGIKYPFSRFRIMELHLDQEIPAEIRGSRILDFRLVFMINNESRCVFDSLLT